MKILIQILFVFCFTVSFSQTFEIYNGDTINRIDVIGKKQGKWVVFGKHKPGRCYKENQVVEMGSYKDNRKTGTWEEYFCNGKKKNELEFNDGRPNGKAVVYHENGVTSESGTWRNNRWTGKHKIYDTLGTVLFDWLHDEKGKRIQDSCTSIYDVQKGDRYNIRICNNCVTDTLPNPLNGFHGLYNKDRRIAKEGFFKDNHLKHGKIYIYNQDGFLVNIMEKDSTPDQVFLKIDTSKKIWLNGYHTLYNNHRLIAKDGFFKNNLLVDGRSYSYNDKLELTRIQQFQNGAYKGEVQIPDSVSKIQSFLEHKTLYDNKNRLVEEGSYIDGEFWSGEKYFYDKSGALIRVKKYKDRQYIGDSDLPH